MGRRTLGRWLAAAVLVAMAAAISYAQQSGTSASLPGAAARLPGSFAADLRTYVEMPGVTGYEQPLVRALARELAPLHPRTDSLGNLLVTVGSGAPARLLATPLDEPGYAVSGIDPDGYLRLQRLPTRANLPLFNTLASAQPVLIGTRAGGWANGVVAGLSIHLQPGRRDPPDPEDIDNMYVDAGAPDAASVRAAGIDILSPVLLDRKLYVLGGGLLTAPDIGDRFGVAAALEVLRRLDPARLQGTLTVAFLVQQWDGARGLARVLQEISADQIVYLGRMQPPGGRGGREAAPPPAAEKPCSAPLPGDGVLLAGNVQPLAALAASAAIPVCVNPPAAPFLPASANGAPVPPAVHVSVPIAWPATPAELLSGNDVAAAAALLEAWLGQAVTPPALPAAVALPEPALPPRPATAPTPTAVLQQMVRPYAVHPNDAPSGAMVQRLLPPWAHPVTDDAGNIILHLGPADATAPALMFVAHQDEIGYQVESIAGDGRLVLRARGGGEADFYIGHVLLVHTATGMRPGVSELPPDWRTPGFRLTAGRGGVRMDVGARSAAAAGALGIQTGDTVTVPKAYRPLLDRRASARAFDDRVGDSALIAAAWALGPSLAGRNVTLVWSTGEETGLEGATALAHRLAAAGQTPACVFAVDTFVSSDSPLESQRFADTPIGRGFVIRAIDDSSLVPWDVSRKLAALAAGAGIPVQYGATGGGNDGSAFLPYGALDIPLGWPLRYSHSPGEVIDLRDLDSLTRAVELIARQW